jgi:hypothetical protein
MYWLNRKYQKMRPQSAKSKGRRHQQRIVSDILAAFPHLAEDDVVSTPMGAPGVDVRLSAAAKQSLPLAIEAKNCETLNIWKCVDQCTTNTRDGEVPCVVFTRNRANVYAVLPWMDLLQLYKRVAQPPQSLPPRLVHLLRELVHFAPSDATSPEPPGSGSASSASDLMAEGVDHDEVCRADHSQK